MNLDDAIALLPTPAARDAGRGSGYTEQEGRPLSETIHRLLPTPRASDGVKGGPNQRGSSGDLMLPAAVMLLPTPTATPYGNNQSPSPGAAVRPSLDSLFSEPAKLLPTPCATDAKGARNATSGRKPDSQHHSGETLLDVFWNGMPTSPPSDDGNNCSDE
jgi:hypothetical protein